MTETLDGLRVQLRRRAIAEGWPTTRALVAEDTAETAREDGTHALRSISDQAERLGISERSVKRHRAELVRLGAFAMRRKGGNGRGATVLDLAGSGDSKGPRLSGKVAHDSRGSTDSKGPPVSVDVARDSTSRGPVGGQLGATVERERGPGLLSLSPKASKPAEPEHQEAATMHTDPTPTADSGNGLAAHLAAAKGWPVDHCRKVLDAKRAELVARGINYPDALLRKIVAENPHELPAPVVVRATLAQCDGGECPGSRHEWTDARNRYVCMGA